MRILGGSAGASAGLRIDKRLNSMAHAEAHHEGEEHHPTGWRRYVYSTNHKDIGTMYLVFAIVGGVIGGILSIIMRMELQTPGIQYFHGLAQIMYGVDAGAAVPTARTCTTCS
jgi:cytochrome c oxidase subunit I